MREPCSNSLTRRLRQGVFYPGDKNPDTVIFVLNLSRFAKDLFGFGGGRFNVCDIICLAWITNSAFSKIIEYPDIFNHVADRKNPPIQFVEAKFAT